MAVYDNLDPVSLNVEGVEDLVSSKVNRVTRGISNESEGPRGPEKDVLELDMTDSELLLLSNQWSAAYAGYEGKIKPKQEKNREYYLGKQKAGYAPYAFDETPIAGNLLFEATETFLAAALSKEPDPVVWSDGSKEGQALAEKTQTMLTYHAATLNVRRILARMTRQWTWGYLGVIKYGWKEFNEKGEGDITIENRRIQNFIFDPMGYVDVDGSFCGYLGERIKLSARELIDLFPDHKEYIILSTDGKLGTECTYTEWWTDEYTFSTYMDIVLEKHKNQFFKNEEGERNHFAQPKKPYTFLSVFSNGEQPHDITGLIEQNIPNQNLVSKEIQQIDYNISRSNNSTAFSENNFNQQTAKQATQAWIKGHNILVPPGVPIGEAIHDFPANPLPDAFFKNLQMNQEGLRSIFGTLGITATKQTEDTTARGMILNQQRDNSRIGGAISESIEQVAENLFNWLVQLYHVFYDEKHFAAVMGVMKAVEYVELSRADFDRQIVVIVQSDSMKPKDELTLLNQSQALWDGGALGLKTFLIMQKVPDPDEAAEDALLWQLNKQAYLQINYPDLYQQVLSLGAQQAQGGQAATPPTPAIQPIATQPAASGGEPPNAALSQVPLPQ